MRLVIDSLIALMMVTILGGIVLHHRQQEDLLVKYQTAHHELSHIREMVIYHTALDQDALNEWGYPAVILPVWFAGGVPFNRMVPANHPWMDLAPPGDMNDQPPDPIATGPQQAGYWYNPSRGIVRARVTQQFTEQATLALYNQINSTMLVVLPRSKNPDRKPVHDPLLGSGARAGAGDQTTEPPQQSRPSLRNLPTDEGATLGHTHMPETDSTTSAMVEPEANY